MTIKCLFVMDSLGVGGSERKIISVASLLVQRGVDVHLAFLNLNHDISDTIDNNVSIIHLHRKGMLDRKAVRLLHDYIALNQIDYVWSVNLYPMLYAFLASRWLHTPPFLIGSSNITIFRNFYERIKMFIYVPLIWNTHHFVFGSGDQQKIWKERYPLFGSHYSVIHNGVDLETFSPELKALYRQSFRDSFKIRDDANLVGMVAQFRIEKSHTDLLEAVQRANKQGHNYQILFVGDGPTRKDVELKVSQMGMVKDVIFTGLMQDVKPALAAIDLFALTSTSETFSNAALEAMAMGLPLVLSDIGGARDMIRPGINGFYYTPGSVEELTELLKKMDDSVLIKTMGENSRRLVEENFSSKLMVDNYLSILQQF